MARDLADAILSGLSADRRYATAYNAALQTTKMALACAGYRTSAVGHHKTAFEAVELLLGPGSSLYTAYFENARGKRNTLDYDEAYVASETEAEQIFDTAKDFLAYVETWIAINYPAYKI